MPTAPLSVSNSAIKVANAALNELGVSPITSFLDENFTARTVNTSFADTVEEALALYPWRFARAHAQVQRLAKDTPPEWEGVYAAPSGSLAIQKAYIDDRPCEFDINADGVLVNVSAGSASEVFVDYTIYKSPSEWPGYFRRPFIFHLAAALAMPLTQDDKLADRMEQKAFSRMKLAQSRESQGRTPSRIDTKMFIRQRRTGGRSR